MTIACVDDVDVDNEELGTVGCNLDKSWIKLKVH